MNKTKNKICVVGDILLDKYVQGTCSRISPEAPVQIIDHKNSIYLLGGAANVAKNIKSLECNVILCGFVGDDYYSEKIIKLLNKYGIEHCLIKISKQKTLLKERIVVSGKQVLRVDYGDFYNSKGYQKVFFDHCRNHILNSDLLLISDYSKGTVFDSQSLIKLARDNCLKSIVDPKSKNIKDYSGAYLIKPNLNEIKNYLLDAKENEYEIMIRKLCEDNSIEYILNTLGNKGMKLYTKDGILLETKSEAKSVYDVTGAGDTVVASIAISLLEGVGIIEAIKKSNRAAAIAVSKFGTQSVTRSELDSKLYDNEIKFFNSNDYLKLKDYIKSFKNKGKKIVFTNGVFDIFHNGHLSLIKESANLGDVLIVGINSDQSVKNLGKGKNRPLNNINDRAEILSSIEFVDIVCEFDDSTPYNLIKIIQPDILIKGADYALNDIVGKDIVEENGGKVLTIKLKNGYSTTSLIKRLDELK